MKLERENGDVERTKSLSGGDLGKKAFEHIDDIMSRLRTSPEFCQALVQAFIEGGKKGFGGATIIPSPIEFQRGEYTYQVSYSKSNPAFRRDKEKYNPRVDLEVMKYRSGEEFARATLRSTTRERSNKDDDIVFLGGKIGVVDFWDHLDWTNSQEALDQIPRLFGDILNP